MTQINPEIVRKTAKLSLLALSGEEVAQFSQELAQIFPLFDALNHEDISALSPLAHPLELHQPMRPDIAIECDLLASIAENAPEFEQQFITVPKVIE
ncbi:Asp-tRNA(Asn)/Glu-tRNA(Gln) amidotransferase subunit GatC [Dichelobacter nodosus]|uniref:Asp-tRNA(Asn)/Glu-tRNA(Gln) amidotransferase subunit GatC n=1 Tax=Dichelobacter nodosus TaxID=870 RepID=UPI000E29D12A|nr:Asp-tRNA(Asn)/Glu-tRNA(Gln) amidotransferase subunit GatC [Dichelobacter nodosus]AXM45754.1 Asp-tRNA(Asn)/Glu-tRNA(Gln) amidotransferase GatCAB subunit C [Dichelobacter nodosus]